jgi:hypothetical protein
VRGEIKKYTKGKGDGVNDKDTDTLKVLNFINIVLVRL